ncbi:MAG TPA: BamA/TamA family outer membrane protein, partial [Rhizorhapis sp.]|nr:BamA/TamA family outer membrane protein [Rhizorhapis sp.]
RTFFIGALPLSLAYDGSDDLLDPKSGFRLGMRVSPELSFQSGTLGYVRAQLDGSAYQPVTGKVVLAGRVRLGTIVGAQRDQIAPSRRFYAGGGGSVRGYGYQDIGPRDANDDPIGGRSLAEFSLEARIRFGNFGVVPFVDAGNISTGQLPNFGDLQLGAGLGLRYYSNFGPIRIDVGTPLNPQPGDPKVAVYVSLGQAF